ncbi:MAG: hypothetical protein JRH20_32860, partial [Deltaproteobacteria bacterium]|nr:hypothetical protein [Deltaproteobacteria bacterium]
MCSVFHVVLLWALTAGPTPQTQPMTMPAAEVVAQARPRVVLLGMSKRFPKESWQAVERRTRAELSALGLEVVPLAAHAEGMNARLQELRTRAVEQRAIGALRISRHHGKHRVQLWVYDALTRKTVLHNTVVAPEDGKDASGIVALRLVGLLHASLLELRMRGRGRVKPRPVPPLVTRLVAARLDPPPSPKTGRWLMWGGPSVGLAHLNASPSASLRLGGGLRVLPWLVLGVEGSLPLSLSRLDPEDPRGAATLITFALQGQARLEPWATGRVSPALSLGVGAIIVRAEGEAV